MTDKIYTITSGTLDINFENVPFDSKSDFKTIKQKIKLATRKIVDEYNGYGVDVEFSDDIEGEYIE